jgi:type VI secretion system secreted protein Hcp
MEHSNVLLAITGVKGSSTLDGHKDEIECLSWSFNVSQICSNFKSGQQRTLSNPNFSDIAITKESDIASTELFRLCATGKDIDKVVLTVERKADGGNKSHIKIEMDKVILSNYSIASGNERPIETICLNYVKIKMEYHHQSADGKIVGKTDFGYDLAENKSA